MRPAFASFSVAIIAACAVQPPTEALPPPNPGGSFELVFDGVIDGRLMTAVLSCAVFDAPRHRRSTLQSRQHGRRKS